MRSTFISSSFTKFARHSYLMFILMAIGLLFFQVYAIIYALNEIPIFFLILSLGFLAGCALYSYKKGEKYFDVEAAGENIIVKNKNFSIAFTVTEISTIQILGTDAAPMPYLTVITLHEEKDGHRHFEFLAANNGYEEKYLFNPFIKAGGKVEKKLFWI